MSMSMYLYLYLYLYIHGRACRSHLFIYTSFTNLVVALDHEPHNDDEWLCPNATQYQGLEINLCER